MQSTSTLDVLDKNLPCVFSSNGDTDQSIIQEAERGVSALFATPLSEGGALVKRTTINSIGMIATTELFMAKIGCVQTYVQGVSYAKYAKLEYVDSCSISHTVFATRQGLGDFNSDTSLISNSAWKNAGSQIIPLLYYFN